MRAAVLPFDSLLKWTAELRAQQLPLDDPALDVTLTRERRELCDRLRALVGDPVFQEALYLASPSTYQQIGPWLADADAENPKLERALTRYVQRMAGRATPFGLFAGVGLGRVGGRTALELASPERYQRKTRLDSYYLSTLAERLERDEAVRKAKRFMPNSSLYKAASCWRYVHATSTALGRDHQLVAIDSDEYIDTCIERSRDGVQLATLVSALVESDPDGEITADDAEAYVRELVDRQILVSDLAPAVTGPDPLDELIASLAAVDAASAAVHVLRDVRERLHAIDARPLGLGPDPYKEVQRRLEALAVPVDPSRLFQSDLVAGATSGVIGSEHLDALSRVCETMHRLMPAENVDPFHEFKEAFRRRYGEQVVPLVEALDEESGIGFARSTDPAAEPAVLLEGLTLRTATATADSWTARDVFLLRRVHDIVRAGGAEMVLTASDIDQIASAAPPPVPDAFAVFATLVSTEDPSGRRAILRNAHGPSGAALLGRFCHLDEELLRAVRKHLAREQAFDPEAVFAEVVHLPHGRAGNILTRPLLREYEIAYLGRSGAPVERQIGVQDLLVTIEDDQVVLRSTRLGRRIVPRLSNAHAYNRGQSVYRFLCTLQAQGICRSIYWDWGPLGSAAYLPRVVIGDVVVARASWRLSASERAAFSDRAPRARWVAVQQWRAAHRVPRFVALVETDHELPVDLDNALSVETMCALLKKSSGLFLEMLPEPHHSPVRSAAGRHAHEVIVPFVCSRRTAKPLLETQRVARPTVARRFPPGSEWIYLKLYTGTGTADRLLQTDVAALVDRLDRAASIDRWFFIRYGDPDWHLRFRVRVAPGIDPAQVRSVIEQAAATALSHNLVHQVQLDTYDREIERYGGDLGIDISERLFWRDSETAVDILAAVAGHGAGAVRWHACLKSWDTLLDDFGFSLAAKHRLVAESRDYHYVRYAARKRLELELGQKFRAARKDLEDLLFGGGHRIRAVEETLGMRSARLSPDVSTLRELDAGGHVSLVTLLRSYLHMNANRLLRSAHHPQEMVLFDFLERLYGSQLARQRGRGRPGPVRGLEHADA